jgi:hypothetical protein
MNKYEQLIEYIINEQEDKARELFHQIVVEKSREIYENLIDEEPQDEMSEVDSLIDEIDADQEGMSEADDEMNDMGDAMDADMEMDADMGEPDMGMDDEMGGEGELEDRVMDLESALDELKAEFDKLMADEMDEPEHADMDDMGGEEPKEEAVDPAMVREYVDKVASPANQEGNTVGAQSSSKPAVNAKSIVAGKNDMGGTTASTLKGGAEQAADGKATPHPSNQYAKGKGNLPHAGSYENVPGAKSKGYSDKAAAKSGEQSVNARSPLAK